MNRINAVYNGNMQCFMITMKALPMLDTKNANNMSNKSNCIKNNEVCHKMICD